MTQQENDQKKGLRKAQELSVLIMKHKLQGKS